MYETQNNNNKLNMAENENMKLAADGLIRRLTAIQACAYVNAVQVQLFSLIGAFLSSN